MAFLHRTMPLLTELYRFGNRRATKMPALTGFETNTVAAVYDRR
jgi:hypothetical protein